MNTIGEAWAVMGLQYGDEGKGKFVDALAVDCDVVARGNGGPNAGHTIVLENGERLALHQLPSGVAHEHTVNVIGPGVFLDPVKLLGEIKEARRLGISVTPDSLKISNLAHLILPVHVELDEAREKGYKKQGSTKSGIAYVAADKSMREGIRGEIAHSSTSNIIDAIDTRRGVLISRFLEEYHLPGLRTPEKTEEIRSLNDDFAKSLKTLEPYFDDTTRLIYEKLQHGNRVLLEGAQAFGLDMNYGKYPYSSSSDTTISGLLSGTGVSWEYLNRAIGVAKLYPSKVGGGMFLTKIEDEEIVDSIGGIQGEVDAEYGATTGRKREIGWLDIPQLRRSAMVSGITEIAISKMDCAKRAGDAMPVAVAYSETNKQGAESVLIAPDIVSFKSHRPEYFTYPTWDDPNSKEAASFIASFEKLTRLPVTMYGTGPGRYDLVLR